jgi:hypothetical protein
MAAIVSVAVFILATSKLMQQKSAFHSRVGPIMSTWGTEISNIFFVFGNDPLDQQFLQQNCTSSSLMNQNVNLNDQLQIFDCIQPNQKQFGVPIRVLSTRNCTGRYFGFSPTCRCQESMRFFVNNNNKKESGQLFSATEWFAFMDDDLYIRPYSLNALLHQLSNNNTLLSQSYNLSTADPIALVSTDKYRGFAFRRWNKAVHQCAKHSFPIAMPAILNRNTLNYLASCLNVNCLITQRSIWGGTHDAILGLIFWLYQIPVLSMASFYQEKQTTTVELKKYYSGVTKNSIQHKNFVYIVHRVKNMLTARNTTIPRSRICSMINTI